LVVSRKVPTFPNLAKLTMKNDYYTYAYLRKDGTPYYIGKGKGDRAFRRRGRCGCKAPLDESFILILKKNLTEEEAFKHEIYMIAVLGRKDLGTGILRNFTDGGEGPSGAIVTEATRAKMSASQRGRKHSEDTKKKIGIGSRGKIMSQEAREKIGNVHRGKVETAETRARKSAAHKGKKHSPETIEKMRKSARERWEKKRKVRLSEP
jgi:hypothetical protein